jgi:hypothetical protein
MFASALAKRVGLGGESWGWSPNQCWYNHHRPCGATMLSSAGAALAAGFVFYPTQRDPAASHCQVRSIPRLSRVMVTTRLRCK